jgi:putative ABC transport system ATP-binding protein
MPLIATRQLVKTYMIGDEAIHALSSVSLSIDVGEFVAIMGPSGSGKSTMMHILGCLDVPTAGSYLLGGVEVSRLGDRDLALIRNNRIGFVFQSFNLLPRTSALDNVQLPMYYGRHADRRQKAEWALAKVGLTDRMHHAPNQLSGGQQQRVAIARSLVNDAPLIMADEPTGNLASYQSEQIMGIFQDLNNEGKTIVIVTHEPEIAQHARRIVRFHDGRIVGDETVNQRMFAADILQQRHPEQLT